MAGVSRLESLPVELLRKIALPARTTVDDCLFPDWTVYSHLRAASRALCDALPLDVLIDTWMRQAKYSTSKQAESDEDRRRVAMLAIDEECWDEAAKDARSAVEEDFLRVLRTGNWPLYKRFASAGLYELRPAGECGETIGCDPQLRASIESGSLTFVQNLIAEWQYDPITVGRPLVCKGGENLSVLILCTGVHVALFEGHMDIVNFLFEAWKETSTSWPSRNSAESIAFRAAGAGNLEIVRCLADNNVRLTTLSSYLEDSPLYVAAAAGHKEVVKLILDRAPDAKIDDALAGAEAGGHSDIKEMCMTRKKVVDAVPFTLRHSAMAKVIVF
ncbi:hypothetical protein HDU88_004976 [Geranomyces variabilis]|nr:hypothetical protein HDU88_004976 [Geranomyces variabilis]